MPRRNTPKLNLKQPAIPVTSSVAELEAWAERINDAYKLATEAIFEAGDLLLQAKADVGHGNWLPILDKLDFSRKWAERLMKVAKTPHLAKAPRGRLPAGVRVLEELSRLGAEDFEAGVESGEIHSEMTVADAREVRLIEVQFDEPRAPVREVRLVHAEDIPPRDPVRKRPAPPAVDRALRQVGKVFGELERAVLGLAWTKDLTIFGDQLAALVATEQRLAMAIAMLEQAVDPERKWDS